MPGHSRLAQLSIGLAATLCASQAVAENWVTLGTTEEGDTVIVDKDSIRRADDGIVYFSADLSSKDNEELEDRAVDCQNRIIYTLRGVDEATIRDNWRAANQS